jgi:DNA-binding YbaB/EbfC family protein
MFDNLKNLGQMADLMRNAGAIKEKMRVMQEEIARQEHTADAGDGRVTATVNGRLEVLKVRIDKTRLNLEDTSMLEDLITAAVAAAQGKAAEATRQQMQKMASEMGIPPGML